MPACVCHIFAAPMSSPSSSLQPLSVAGRKRKGSTAIAPPGPAAAATSTSMVLSSSTSDQCQKQQQSFSPRVCGDQLAMASEDWVRHGPVQCIEYLLRSQESPSERKKSALAEMLGREAGAVVTGGAAAAAPADCDDTFAMYIQVCSAEFLRRRMKNAAAKGGDWAPAAAALADVGNEEEVDDNSSFCCPIAMEPFDKAKVDFLPDGTSFIKDRPELCAAILPCGHSFHALSVLCHMALSGMRCPVCRYGCKSCIAYESIPEHLRMCIAQKVREVCVREVEEMMQRDRQAAEEMGHAMMSMGSGSGVERAADASIIVMPTLVDGEFALVALSHTSGRPSDYRGQGQGLHHHHHAADPPPPPDLSLQDTAAEDSAQQRMTQSINRLWDHVLSVRREFQRQQRAARQMRLMSQQQQQQHQPASNAAENPLPMAVESEDDDDDGQGDNGTLQSHEGHSRREPMRQLRVELIVYIYCRNAGTVQRFRCLQNAGPMPPHSDDGNDVLLPAGAEAEGSECCTVIEYKEESESEDGGAGSLWSIETLEYELRRQRQSDEGREEAEDEEDDRSSEGVAAAAAAGGGGADDSGTFELAQDHVSELSDFLQAPETEHIRFTVHTTDEDGNVLELLNTGMMELGEIMDARSMPTTEATSSSAGGRNGISNGRGSGRGPRGGCNQILLDFGDEGRMMLSFADVGQGSVRLTRFQMQSLRHL